jgi:adenylate/nucleoside-diphosphate kinase
VEAPATRLGLEDTAGEEDPATSLGLEDTAGEEDPATSLGLEGTAEEEAAAAKIQAGFKGMQVRREMAAKKAGGDAGADTMEGKASAAAEEAAAAAANGATAPAGGEEEPPPITAAEDEEASAEEPAEASVTLPVAEATAAADGGVGGADGGDEKAPTSPGVRDGGADVGDGEALSSPDNADGAADVANEEAPTSDGPAEAEAAATAATTVTTNDANAESDAAPVEAAVEAAVEASPAAAAAPTIAEQLAASTTADPQQNFIIADFPATVDEVKGYFAAGGTVAQVVVVAQEEALSDAVGAAKAVIGEDRPQTQFIQIPPPPPAAGEDDGEPAPAPLDLAKFVMDEVGAQFGNPVGEEMHDADAELGNTRQYCPVVLASKGVLHPGSSDFSAKHRDRWYHMSSQGARDEFAINPAKYVDGSRPPVAPVVRICALGHETSGKSQHVRRFAKRHRLMQVSFPDLLEQVAADEAHKLHKEVKEHLGEDQVPLEPEVTLELVRPFWHEPPYSEQGLVLEGFPRDDEDVQLMAENSLFPDVALVFTVDGAQAVRRAMPRLWKTFCKGQDDEKAKRKKAADERAALAKKRYDDWLAERTAEKAARKAEREAARLAARQARIASGGAAAGSDAEEDSEAEEDEEDEEDEYEPAEDDEDEEEAEELEDPDEAKTRIEEEIVEKHEAVSEGASAAGEVLAEEHRVAVVEINADVREPQVRAAFERAVAPFVAPLRRNLFEYVRTISGQQARQLVESGRRGRSAFGLWCPVALKRGTALQPNRGPQYPALYRNQIYTMASAEHRALFCADPLGYVAQPAPPPSLPIRLAVVGPPKSGKSTVAARLEARYGCKVISIESAVQAVLEGDVTTALEREIRSHLEAARELPAALCVRAVAKAVGSYEAQLHGYVLDGHPFTAAEVALMEAHRIWPAKVIELDCPADECHARAALDRAAAVSTGGGLPEGGDELPDDTGTDANIRLRRTTYEASVGAVRQGCGGQRQNWGRVDGARSVWWVATEVERLVADCVGCEQRYWVAQRAGRPAPVVGTGLSEAEVGLKLCQFGLYCPVNAAATPQQLITTPVRDLTNTVEYQGQYWKLADAAAAAAFSAAPAVFAAGRLPALLAERRSAEQVRAAFPMPIMFGGYCPVTYLNGHSEYAFLKEGSHECAAEYDGAIHLLRDEAAREGFLRQPAAYAEAVLPRKLPPRVHKLETSKLPMLGYLEQTVALCVTKSLSQCGLAKPKFPFMSTEQSAMVYTALHLKATNPKATEYSRSVFRGKLKLFAERCELVRYLGKEMAAEHTADRPLGFDGKLSQFVGLEKQMSGGGAA